MSIIFSVLKKELKVTFRDKRTLFSVILVPAIVFPLLFVVMGKVQTKIMKSEMDKKLKVALINPPETFKNNILASEEFQYKKEYTKSIGEIAIQNDSLDAMVEFGADFVSGVNSMQTQKVNVHFKSTNFSIFNRISKELDEINQSILNERIVTLNISKEVLKPIDVVKVDIASKKELFGKIAGGFLPYLFIIICFTGCMYPAIELTTGEKEKGTLETLLTAPAHRFEILLGKVLTMNIMGLLAALMVIIGMFVAVQFLNEVPKEYLDTIYDVLNFKFVLMLLLMLLPLAFFFSGMLSALAVGAKSFKEAQSKIQPMLFVIILPAAMAMIPGIELNWKTVWIPVLNIALATKEIMAETIQMPMYIAIVSSLILVSLAGIYYSYKQFSKENLVLN